MVDINSSILNGNSFIPIPKNAGTSIAHHFSQHNWPVLTDGHDYKRRLAKREIVAIRDPAERFASAFNYSQRYWPSPVNAQFSDANQLAECAGDASHPMYDLAWVELGNRPEDYLRRNGEPQELHTVAGRVLAFTFAYEPQSSWLINNPACILRFRHLRADIETLAVELGVDRDARLPMLNPSELPVPTLSTAARAFVEHIYADDYDFIRVNSLDV